MSKLYFITHPSVLIDKHAPIDQWQLSEKGIEETKRLLKLNFWKNIKAIYSSPEKKAVQVAEMAVNKYSFGLKRESCLSEIDRSSTGFMEYDIYMETMTEFYNNPKIEVNGWESAENATNRIVDCVTKIMNSNTENVAIIGHGATGTLLACHLFNKLPTLTEDPQGTGQYMIVNWDEKKILNKWVKY